MPLEFPPIIWKVLVGEDANAHDLASFDRDALMMLKRISDIYEAWCKDDIRPRETPADPSAGLFWVSNLSDGTSVELHPSGSSELVNMSDIPLFLKVSSECRLQESKFAMLAMRTGARPLLS
jgi:hypothetical protein|tara:strand:- start:266 stop:631 length:366 start_codon:yes stop_codon:yes gene_type:complete